MLKVFGHLNPDTDTTVSAIAYAWYLSHQHSKEATPYVLGPLNKETGFVLERFGVEVPATLENVGKGDSVVIVDTNNPEELPGGISSATLIEIVDHHKLVGGLKSSEPIAVSMRPLASTATIIWQMAREQGFEGWPSHVAGLLLAAVFSDTLKLTSPTTTDTDRQAAKVLAEISGDNPDELADGMFAAKSDLSGRSALDILLGDSKAFTFGDKKVRICSLETTLPDNAHAMREELLAAMGEAKSSEGLDGIFFFVVDILKGRADLLVPGDFERQAAEKAFEKGFSADGWMPLPGVVSRKKQMVPPLEKAISE